jgi:soluble lytic murein transglycosylase-like protein
MAGELPDYKSQVGLGAAPSFTLQPASVPSFEGATKGAEALAGLGNALGVVGQRMEAAQRQTEVATATTDYLTKLNDLEQKYTQPGADYKTAKGGFAEDLRQLELDTAGTISDGAARTRAILEWRRAGIASSRRVGEFALGNEKDANAAALDAQEAEALKSAASAATVAERQAAVDRYFKATEGAASAGWISEQNKVARAQRFSRYIDNADVMSDIRGNPDAALKSLQDPANYGSLDPVTRQGYVTQATAAADERKIGDLVNRTRFKPEIASLELGRVIAVGHADAIFNNGVIPQESGGRADAVSEKGALGVSQILPGTARDMARKLGRNDVADLGDDDLKKKLLEDPGLNATLGRQYFRDMLVRYEGNVPLALAAYNAGPARADEWKSKAEQQFGANYSPAQLASVIGIPETSNYVRAIYQRIGANIDGAGISPAGVYRATNAVGSEIATQDARQDQIARNLAAAGRQTDSITEIFKNGYNVDPERELAWTMTQERAAAKGDLAAAQALRDKDEAKAMAPFHRAAYAMAPAALEAATAQIEAEAAASPSLSAQQLRQLKAFRAVRDEVRSLRNTDPIALGERAQIFQPVAVNVAADPEDPGFRGALAVRGRQGLQAANVYLGPAKALRPEEEKALKERFDNAGPDEQFRILKAFADTLPPRAYEDTVAGVASSNMASQYTAQLVRERPELAREVLNGAALLKSKDVSEKATLVKPAFANKLGGQVYPDPAMQKAVEDAALALYVSRSGRNFTLYDTTDTAGVERAIEDITGPIVKRNGFRTPVPPGMSRTGFTDTLDRLTDEDLNRFGGAYDRNGRPFDARAIGARAVLRPLSVGGSMYVVGMSDASAPDGFQPVWTASEMPRPLVIDMRQLSANAPPPPPVTSYQRGLSDFRRGQAERLNSAREGEAQ